MERLCDLQQISGAPHQSLGGREREREGGRKGEREGERERGREKGREGGRVGGRKGGWVGRVSIIRASRNQYYGVTVMYV